MTESSVILFQGYHIDPEPIGKGAYGTVHLAKAIETNDEGEIIKEEKYALKFFGYTTKCKPVNKEIYREILLMGQLRGVAGVVQLKGTFHDTEAGIFPNKNLECLQPYPVIVMENVEGGNIVAHIVDRAKRNQPFSEKYLATLFKSFILALDSIHKKNFIHCDLKGGNVLLASGGDGDESSPSVKIIDFGHMKELRNGEKVFRHNRKLGTPPFLAPESLGDDMGIHQYSAKSDVWQAGCLLYCILCLHVPFTDDAKTKKGDYLYHTQQYGALSMDAKKLLFAMFRPNPDERISITGILHHPWLSSASDEHLYHGYAQRVRSLWLLPEIKKIIRNLKKRIKADRRGQQPSLDDVESTSTVEVKFSAPSSSAAEMEFSGPSSNTLDMDFFADVGDGPRKLEQEDNSTIHDDYAYQLFFNDFEPGEKGHISKERFISVLAEKLEQLHRDKASNDTHSATTSSVQPGGGMCPIIMQGIEDLYRVMDLNGDGFIEFSEFQTFFKEAQFDLSSLTIPPSLSKTSSYVLAEQRGRGIQGDGHDDEREEHAKKKRKLALLARNSC